MLVLKLVLFLFALFYMVPLGTSAFLYWRTGMGGDWWTADRSSAGLLPPATNTADAVVRVFSAPTVRWRGVFAVHCWIVLKPEGAASYTRYHYTAWGEPIRRNGFEPDGRWFGRVPEVVFAADGPAASAVIPRLQAAITGYAFRNRGDYRVWPGPNSNTFVAAVLDAVPEVRVTLPPNAIGKDYPYDGRWLRAAPSGTGLRLTLGGYAGLTVAWVEGIEVNILGGVVGIDVQRPAIKLPGLGRIALSRTNRTERTDREHSLNGRPVAHRGEPASTAESVNSVREDVGAPADRFGRRRSGAAELSAAGSRFENTIA